MTLAFADTPVGATGVATTNHTLRITGVDKTLGGNRVVADFDLDVRAGELVCLLGASGCGKTTTLRMIGGFLTPDHGSIEIDGIDYTNASPESRPTAMVFQNYALWPHMTVFENVAFGLRIRKMAKRDIAERVEAVLQTVGLAHHSRAHPGAISGGEQQRVALARALVLEPSVMLLDEPLSNLDAKLRIRVREEIRELQRRTGVTMVFVTHDQEEALSLADRVAVMNAGRVEQYDAPDTVYRSPATLFAARFIGSMNLLAGSVAEPGVLLDGGAVLTIDEQTNRLPIGDSGTVGIRPEDVLLGPVQGAALTGDVMRDIPLGHYREVTVRVQGGDIKVFTGTTERWSGRVGVCARRGVWFAGEQDA